MRMLWVQNVTYIYLFIYYVIFTQEYPISAQHCSPWGLWTYPPVKATYSTWSFLMHQNIAMSVQLYRASQIIARFTFCPIRHKQLARNIPLYRKADWPSFNNHMLQFHARILGDGAPTLEVNQLWVEFKQAIHSGISKYIPHKLAKSTNRKPWVSRETVKPGLHDQLCRQLPCRQSTMTGYTNPGTNQRVGHIGTWPNLTRQFAPKEQSLQQAKIWITGRS